MRSYYKFYCSDTIFNLIFIYLHYKSNYRPKYIGWFVGDNNDSTILTKFIHEILFIFIYRFVKKTFLISYLKVTYDYVFTV